MSTALPRSATAVALLADVPSTGHVGEARAQRFTMHGDGIGERSAAFVAFARQQLAADRKVVALYPAWRRDDAQRAVNFARGALRTDHIAGVPMDLAPLALSLVADQLAYLAPYLPPGMVAALSVELPRHLLAGAWLRTVSGLETIPTSVRQHMGSYAPAVSFLAYCAPAPRVERLRPAEVARRLPFRPVQPVQLLYSTPDPSLTRVFDDNLPQAIQPVATRSLPAQPLGPAYWGTAKYVEFVALSAHPQALAYAAGAVRASVCSWCGEPMAGSPCPFCASASARSPLRTRIPTAADGHRPASGTGTWTAPHGNGHPPGAPKAAARPPAKAHDPAPAVRSATGPAEAAPADGTVRHGGPAPSPYDDRLPLEAEALPPIAVDEGSWHSTVDGLPYGTAHHTVSEPPEDPGTGVLDTAPEAGPRSAGGPGPRPPGPDRTEHPPFAGRAPRPEPPRTYSR